MELDITPEFATKHALTPEQVTAVKGLGADFLTTTTKTLEEKFNLEAVTKADNILDDATKHIAEKTKLVREKGEKAADYVARASSAFLASGQSEIERLKTEYNEKIKNFEGDPETKKELETLKGEVDRLKKIEAEFEPIKGVKADYDALVAENGRMKVDTAFGNSRPAFPATANKYEVDAKWDAFKNKLLGTHNVDIVDGEAWAIDKTNEHKRSKISELALADPDILALTKGRTPSGSGTTVDDITVEGVPFAIKADATSEERSAAIKKYLTEEKKINFASNEYSIEFAKYNKLLLESKK